MPTTIARCRTTGRLPPPTSSARPRRSPAGRYKAVNMAGASVISALLNSLGRRDLPFVFGGDGALVAVPGSAIEQTRQALAAVKTWVAEELELDLRAAIVPMADIRAARARRARRPLPGELGDFLRHVHRRRRELGEGGDEGRPLRDRRRARRHAARPHRAVLPLEPDRGPSWRDRLDHRGAGRRRQRRRSSRSSSPTSWRCRRRGPRRPSGSGGRPGLRLSAKRHGLRSSRGRAQGKAASAQAPGLCRGGAVADSSTSSAARLAASTRCSTRATSSRNSDFRKFDDGLKMTIDVDAERLARIESRLEEAASAGHLPLRAAPPELGADDLHRAVADAPATTCISSTARPAATRWPRSNLKVEGRLIRVSMIALRKVVAVDAGAGATHLLLGDAIGAERGGRNVQAPICLIPSR